MKKNNLKLSRETIRNLSSVELRGVDGGLAKSLLFCPSDFYSDCCTVKQTVIGCPA